jgi:cytochrome c oxidase cbb3-type subunit 3
MIAYPAWPLITTATAGLLGYSSRAEIRAELDAAELQRADYVAAISATSVEDILADDQLRIFATASGAAAFRVNCVQCHGSGAQGSPGYPNLNDDDWLWGGRPEDIQTSIAHGIRFSEDPDTRYSEMPAFGDFLEAGEIRQIANFVATFAGTAGELSDADLAAGREGFEANCSSCHGAEGKGEPELGAPDLTDAIWFYGSSPAEIAAQIRAPKHGVMPAWGTRLGETTVKELTVYVHSLGGGE